jgi:hypothetical protein
MRQSIRPDVRARFQALVARVDAQVRSERQEFQKRSAGLLARQARERARTTDFDSDTGTRPAPSPGPSAP